MASRLIYILLMGPSANTLSNYVHNTSQFIESLALAIARDNCQMPLPETMVAPVFRVVDDTMFTEAYRSNLSPTGSEPVAQNVIPIFVYYCSATVRKIFNGINRYLRMTGI